MVQKESQNFQLRLLGRHRARPEFTRFVDQKSVPRKVCWASLPADGRLRVALRLL